MSPILESMVRAAREASRLIMDVYGREFAVDYKTANDPVTEADRLANTALCLHLQREFPGVPIVAEESDPEQYADYRNSERIFFVDPLDGTREFVSRTDEFVVMIGLVQGDRATHGVVMAPSSETVWLGEVGRGAERIERDGARHRIAPGIADRLARARVVVSRSHGSGALDRALRTAGVLQVQALGSAGLKSATVAEGKADAYLALGNAGRRWDVCAPEALVTAAGGCFTDARGQRFDYRAEDLTNSHGILAAGPRVHEQILRHWHTLSDEDNSQGKP